VKPAEILEQQLKDKCLAIEICPWPYLSRQEQCVEKAKLYVACQMNPTILLFMR
jgi:hypothetical protein